MKEGHEREQTSDKKSYSLVSRSSASPITNGDTQTDAGDTRHDLYTDVQSVGRSLRSLA